MGETSDGSAEVDQLGVDDGGGRAVRVSYEPRGFGVALVVGDGDGGTAGADGGNRSEAGVLRVSDAVVTLEIPLADGGRSVLSWDPAEVGADPLAT